MRFLTGAIALLLTACWLLPGQSSSSSAARSPSAARRAYAGTAAADPAPAFKGHEIPPATDKLTYDIEWRLIHAGEVLVETQKSHAKVRIESAGLVSSLFKVEDDYSVTYDDPFCAASSRMDAQEGKRHRETMITFDHADGRADYLERDALTNAIIRSTHVDTPPCVHDVLGAFLTLRGTPLEPGSAVQLPVTDGRRSASVKVEAQEREEVQTPSGSFKTIRCEAYLLDGVVYSRKGHVFVWFTDDARRLPVQLRLRMQFPVGTVTLQLSKEEHL
jgi:hypothetical protein